MLDLLLFPFKLLWGLVEGVWGLVTGLISFIFGLISGVFGLVGGMISLVVTLTLGGIAIAVVVEFVRRHRVQHKKADDDFISYYDKDAVR